MEDKMNEYKSENSCENKGSCSSDSRQDWGHDEKCTMAEDILSLAKCAKHELLKEKMKKQLEAKIGKKLDKVAEVTVDALIACMQHKMNEGHACDQYKENLMAAWK